MTPKVNILGQWFSYVRHHYSLAGSLFKYLGKHWLSKIKIGHFFLSTLLLIDYLRVKFGSEKIAFPKYIYLAKKKNHFFLTSKETLPNIYVISPTSFREQLDMVRKGSGNKILEPFFDFKEGPLEAIPKVWAPPDVQALL